MLMVCASLFDFWRGMFWFRYSISNTCFFLLSLVFDILMVCWVLVLVPGFMALQWCLGGYDWSRKPRLSGLPTCCCLL